MGLNEITCWNQEFYDNIFPKLSQVPAKETMQYLYEHTEIGRDIRNNAISEYKEKMNQMLKGVVQLLEVIPQIKVQRAAYKQQILDLKPGQCVLVYDFKQDLELPEDVEIDEKTNTLKKKYLAYPSEILKKDIITVLDCVKNAFQQELLKSATSVNVWFDGALVIRAGYLLWSLLDPESDL
ncbi:MAG: hypothetical protein EZS28_017676 [Streblomastix strix]|uniref:Uncharacterized protein n=1 Tax=Streblomastix strix TaxID=222440 RepID=A0A5J4VXA9_9EUKA|nr:MAG: hypothetical protein EZS28_017676 [Streblomastix strix]